MEIPLIPEHTERQYPALGYCVYCGSPKELSKEHIIPLSLGGKWVFPQASCRHCSTLTAKFEGVCMRASLGPFRMYFDFPSRRKAERPNKIPLKVKFKKQEHWDLYEVEREEYPFLITLPIFDMPELLGGPIRTGRRDAATDKIWIRSPNFGDGFYPHLEHLTRKYGFREIFPEGATHIQEFVRMLAKIAHCYTVAELGETKFIPYLEPIIREENATEVVSLLGGMIKTEPRTTNLHEISFVLNPNNLVVVRIRLLSHFEAPTYYVVSGFLKEGQTK